MKNFAYSILGCLLLSLNAALLKKHGRLTGRTPYFPVTVSHC